MQMSFDRLSHWNSVIGHIMWTAQINKLINKIIIIIIIINTLKLLVLKIFQFLVIKQINIIKQNPNISTC